MTRVHASDVSDRKCRAQGAVQRITVRLTHVGAGAHDAQVIAAHVKVGAAVAGATFACLVAGLGALVVLGDDLVAGTVVTKGVAKRQMHINRQRLADAADVALGEPLLQLGLVERLDEAVRGRVGRVARAAHVVPADQHRVDDQLGSREMHGSDYERA